MNELSFNELSFNELSSNELFEWIYLNELSLNKLFEWIKFEWIIWMNKVLMNYFNELSFDELN